MNFRNFIGVTIVSSVLLVSQTLAQSAGQSPDHLGAAKYFPATTAVYLEIQHPDQLIETVQSHQVVKTVLANKQVKQAMMSPQFAMAMLGVGLVESKIEEPLIDSIKTNLSEGISIGVDTKTNGIAILFRSSDEDKLKRLAGTTLNVIASTAKQQNTESPFKKQNYRDAVAAEFDGFLVARYKTWFVVTNKPNLAKTIVDNLIDDAPGGLAEQTWFTQSREQASADSDVTMAIDLETLRSAGVAKELFKGKTDNPGLELVLGGVLDALQHAPVAVGNLNLNQNLEVSFSVPFDKEWATEARRYFFGEQLKGFAPEPLLPKNMIANLVSYRDIADWWLSKEDLFEENVIAQLAQVDSQLSTIFSGMDFGEDVLGSLQPGIQIVVAENVFEKDYTPDVKLPAFALVGKLKDPERIRRKMKIAFQSVVGFANINLGMQGQPQLDLETETIGSAKISAARYFYDDQTEDGLLLFNFSPTIAFQGDYLIVSSGRDLAIELAEVASKKGADSNAPGTTATNTRFNLDAVMLAKILAENRESLVANNMLEEGNDRKTAEEAIEALLSIVDLFKDTELDFKIQPDKMSVDFQLRIQDSK